MESNLWYFVIQWVFSSWSHNCTFDWISVTWPFGFLLTSDWEALTKTWWQAWAQWDILWFMLWCRISKLFHLAPLSHWIVVQYIYFILQTHGMCFDGYHLFNLVLLFIADAGQIYWYLSKACVLKTLKLIGLIFIVCMHRIKSNWQHKIPNPNKVQVCLTKQTLTN